LTLDRPHRVDRPAGLRGIHARAEEPELFTAESRAPYRSLR